MPRLTSSQEKRSCCWEFSSRRRRAWAFSEVVRKRAVSIEFGRAKKLRVPMATVSKPSIIKLNKVSALINRKLGKRAGSHPAPAFQPTSGPDGVKASSKKTTERAREGRGSVKDADSKGKFGSFVEVRKVQDHSGQKTAFSNT